MKRFFIELWKDLTVWRKPLPPINPNLLEPIDTNLREYLLDWCQKN